MKIYRQGDVLITEVGEMPIDTKRVVGESGRVVLAYGELTGHCHAISARGAALYELDGSRWLVVSRASVDLCHEEHAPITIPSGTYRVIKQREYTPEALRYVAD